MIKYEEYELAKKEDDFGGDTYEGGLIVGYNEAIDIANEVIKKIVRKSNSDEGWLRESMPRVSEYQ